MFWNILFVLICISLITLTISFIITLILVIGDIWNLKPIKKIEKSFPNVSDIILKTLMTSIVSLLITLIPWGINECIKKLNDPEDYRYKVTITEDEIKLTDEEGKTYTVIIDR